MLSIKDALIGDVQKIFSFPALSTFMGLFGLGEAFHPRIRLNDLGFAAGGFGVKHVVNVGLYTQIVAALTIYLADAKLIKFTGTIAESQQCLQEDIEMQKQELLQSEIQHFISIDRQEKVDFLHHIIMPWLQRGGSLKNISDDMLKMFSDDLINILTDEQLASLPQKTLEQLKKDRPFSERLNPKKPLAPEPGRRLTKWF